MQIQVWERGETTVNKIQLVETKRNITYHHNSQVKSEASQAQIVVYVLFNSSPSMPDKKSNKKLEFHDAVWIFTNTHILY